jgi:hypothetical protein
LAADTGVIYPHRLDFDALADRAIDPAVPYASDASEMFAIVALT